MKLWINPIGFEHAKQLLKNKNVDYVVVGLKQQMSVRNTCLLGFEQINELNCSKLAVSINNLFVDDQLPTLTNVLKQLKQIKVKTIIFTDFAVKQIADEIKYQANFVYNSETLATNFNQLLFYRQNKINEVILPRELFLNEIHEFGKHKSKVKLQLQAEGFGLMMHSKWPLLTNFKNQFKIKKDLSNQMFYLKEETRQLPNIIIEDDTGTHMFTGYNVSLIEYLDQLVKDKIDSINFLSFLHDKKWVDETIKIYADALKAIKNKTFNKHKDEFSKRIKDINDVTACGFIEPTKGLLHLERQDSNE